MKIEDSYQNTLRPLSKTEEKASEPLKATVEAHEIGMPLPSSGLLDVVDMGLNVATYGSPAGMVQQLLGLSEAQRPFFEALDQAGAFDGPGWGEDPHAVDIAIGTSAVGALKVVANPKASFNQKLAAFFGVLSAGADKLAQYTGRRSLKAVKFILWLASCAFTVRDTAKRDNDGPD